MKANEENAWVVAGTGTDQWTDWCGRGGGGGVVNWEANRGGTRDRGNSRDVMLPLRQEKT